MEFCKRLILFLVTVMLVQRQIGAQTPGFTFEVQLHSYSNPSHRRGAGGACCDGRGSSCDDQCDTLIKLCLRPAGHLQSSTSCPLGSLAVDESIYSDEDPDHFDLTDSEAPNIFPFYLEEWPEGFQLRIDIIDKDNRRDDDVDTIYIEIGEFTPSAAFTSRSSHEGVYGHSIIDLSFRLMCNEDFYGPACDSFCMPTDDDSGHFTCDADGNIVCLDGYTDPSRNCTLECSPTAGCENQCVLQHPCQNGGTCLTQNMEYICECAEGFEGKNCEHSQAPGTDTPATQAPQERPSSTQATQDAEEHPSLTDSPTTYPAATSSMPDSLPEEVTNTYSTVDTTSENKNNTIVQGRREVAVGTVVGSLVAVLTVVTALSVLGIVVGIVLWRKGKSGRYANEECSNKDDGMDNPMYCAVDTGFIRRSEIPVYTHGNDSDQPSTNHPRGNGNHLRTPAAFVSDEDNTEAVYINQPAQIKRPLTPLLPPSPAPCNTNPLYASVNGNDSIHTKVECISQPAVGIQPLASNSAAHPAPQKPPPPPASPKPTEPQSTVMTSGPKIDPYGNYGDETIQRVALASQVVSIMEQKVGSLFDSPDYDEPVLDGSTTVLVDNCDYEAPNLTKVSVFDSGDYDCVEFPRSQD